MEDEATKKRGWVFDQLMIVGSLEAGMNHNDEEICNLYNRLSETEDPDEIQKIGDEIANIRDLIGFDYQNRVDALNQIFNAIPNSNRHHYCSLKHRATTYIMAAENYHARGGDVESERVLVAAGKALALACSLAFGFEPMDCLRCVSDSMAAIKK